MSDATIERLQTACDDVKAGFHVPQSILKSVQFVLYIDPLDSAGFEPGVDQPAAPQLQIAKQGAQFGSFAGKRFALGSHVSNCTRRAGSGKASPNAPANDCSAAPGSRRVAQRDWR